jgi:hypothetical protein
MKRAMTNPGINVILQKMDDLQKEFFKVQGQIMNKDTAGKIDNPEMYANIGLDFCKGYETMADAVALLAKNDIKSKTRMV